MVVLSLAGMYSLAVAVHCEFEQVKLQFHAQE